MEKSNVIRRVRPANSELVTFEQFVSNKKVLEKALCSIKRRAWDENDAGDILTIAVLKMRPSWTKEPIRTFSKGQALFYKTIRSALCDFYRKEQRTKRCQSLELTVEMGKEPCADPPDLASKVMASEIISQLPPEDREILILSYLKLTVPEIADAMGTTLATAKSHLYRARNRAKAIKAP